MNIFFKSSKNQLSTIMSKEHPHELYTGDLKNSVFLGKSPLYKNNIYFINEMSEDNNDLNTFRIGESIVFNNDHGKLLLDALALLFPLMPGGLDHSLFNPFCKLPRGRLDLDLVFYGGSFNPWHKGHMECLIKCRADNLVIVPDYNPWKEGIESTICRYFSFIEIYKHIKMLPFSIYPGFWAKDRPNPTVLWIGSIKARWVSLLIGDDNFIKILEWTNSDQLLLHLKKLYILRRNFMIDDYEKVKEKVLLINNKLELVYFNDNDYSSLSSTRLREDKKKGL